MAVTWAFKRQLFYVGVLVLFFLILGFLVVYPYFNRPPSCTDGRQNGSETGVDCGGLCEIACIESVSPLTVFWARTFEVAAGRYNAVAYIENPNKSQAIRSVKYKFRFADKNNVYIGSREGVTPIPPAGRYAIFEPAINVGNSVPVYTTFEFTETPIWREVPRDLSGQVKVQVANMELTGETSTPRLTANIRNNSLFTIPNVAAIALLYDRGGNVIAASRTFIEKLPGEGSLGVAFTWPKPIEGVVVAKEIIPVFDIFAAKLP